MNADDQTEEKKPSLPLLALAAIGVVFGDIATSPLYALQAAFTDESVQPTHENILGLLSLCVWSLIVLVTGKYVFFVMRADNHGEGGMLALGALARGTMRGRPKLRWWMIMIGLAGAALFFGDSVITPAISVLSAVEGLKLATPVFQPWVLPIALGILVGLFLLQRRGSSLLGNLFGPVMALWLVVIAFLGVFNLVQHLSVLRALSPQYAITYLAHNGFKGFASLGAVVLVLTGAEALYADVGHFGTRPIRLAWFTLALPALLLNYFGQGALLITNPKVSKDPFYLMVPHALLYPMIGLAACATVIASQAVLSGTFSMVRQGIQLGYIPRGRVEHTSKTIIGQIYMPTVNFMLFVAVIVAVLAFRSSERLSGAYGIAVSGTMFLTSVLMLVVAWHNWHWGALRLLAFGVVYLTIDGAFFSANLLKFFDGGWFPLLIALVMMLVMTTWRRGRELLMRRVQAEGEKLSEFIAKISADAPLRAEGTGVFLTASREWVPQALLQNLKHNQVLHNRNVILHIEGLDTAYADAELRDEVSDLGDSFIRVVLRFGFAEYIDVPTRLRALELEPDLEPDHLTYFLGRDKVETAKHEKMVRWRTALFAYMARNALPATTYYGMPGRQLVEIGTRVEL